MNCSSCGTALAGAPRFCPDCGVAIDPDATAATRTMMATGGGGVPGSAGAPGRPGATPAAGGRDGAATRGAGARVTTSDAVDHGRFLPGTLLADRYRILGLLGRGGMGEVYRADDLKLGQTVALKFLPPELASDPGRLARFHNEVRLARQVSHPNVCRVYDIGDIDGQAYLSMESIDGEDLGTLLRRIGRLPKDKAVEIARQLCAGLAAAHDRGVLHRDLKPSNVMIDGRGRARIADFGLAGVAGVAGVAGGGGGPGTRAGTPAYMAPEHINQGETSIRSDLYALGLVLYELFTGRRVFDGDSIAELARHHRETPPTPPSSHVEDFDPTIERVILRCLEKDPRERPASALAIAAALPGGDPLAMALAAGETPSPEMVAAAGETGGTSPAAVRWCLAALVLGAAILVPLTDRESMLAATTSMKPPDVLIDRARALIGGFGWPDPPAGRAWGLGYHRSYLDHLRATATEAEAWEAIGKPRPTTLFVWYRQSPRVLVPQNPEAQVTADDPPLTIPGMTSIQLTEAGDLWRFFAVPPQQDGAGGVVPAPVDWTPFFAEAGLRMETFEPAEPEWSPPSYADSRVAWIGRYEEAPRWPVRVEAASYRGRAVAFQVFWPWNRPLLMRPFEPGAGEKAASMIILTLAAVATIAGLVIARRHIRQGKGDRRGAFRLGLAVFVATLGAQYLAATHQADAALEWELITRLAGGALFAAAVVWLYYIALEPLVRRRWPDRIIGWSRLVAGRVRDPLVGREILFGSVIGVGLSLCLSAARWGAGFLGHPLTAPPTDLGRLEGIRHAAAGVLDDFAETSGQALFLLFLVVFLRVGLRREKAAFGAFLAIVAGVLVLQTQQALGPLAIAWGILGAVLVGAALGRVGLLALASALFAGRLVGGQSPGFDPSAWYAGASLLPVAVLVVLIAWAALAALAGRSLFESRLLED